MLTFLCNNNLLNSYETNNLYIFLCMNNTTKKNTVQADIFLPHRVETAH